MGEIISEEKRQELMHNFSANPEAHLVYRKKRQEAVQDRVTRKQEDQEALHNSLNRQSEEKEQTLDDAAARMVFNRMTPGFSLSGEPIINPEDVVMRERRRLTPKR